MRNLSETPGAHERDPAWSPDGKSVAWLGDAGGEVGLWVRDARGQGEARRHALPGTGFAYSPQWSPDGRHILYSDEKSRLCYLTLDSGQVTEVAVLRGSLGVIVPMASWSPDSRWIAYEGRNPGTAYDQVVLYRLEDRRSMVLSDAFGSAENPVFSPDGKHLFFKATVDSGPQRFGLDMSATTARASTSSLYVAVLAREGANPLFPRSDEGHGKPGREAKEDGKDGKEGKEAKDGKDGAGDEEAAAAPRVPPTVIDLEGLDQRVLALPLPPKAYGRLLAGKGGLYFLEPGDEGALLKSFTWKARKAEEVARGVDDALLSADGSTLLLQGKEGWHLQAVEGKERKRLAVEQARVRVEPVLEWRQVLREAWRLQRDLFYDPGMHHVDWPAMWERWQAFLPHVRHRADLNLLLGEMLGELACGHQYVSGGEMPTAPSGPGTGLLGADFEVVDGRVRIARILDGQNWNPTLRAPLTEPGVDVRVGDILRSVDGKPVQATGNVLALFEATADTQVELVLERAGEAAPRTVRVVPVASDRELRRRAWIEERRALCERLSGGRLAYVYMPDTGPRGIDAFQRDFFGQVDREGLVLDERYNGGGKVADWVIDILSHDVWCWWMTRTGWAGRTPFATLQGPKVMLVNAYAGSGGDAMPWFFRQQRLGPLVGTRTWGGLVGITGYPPLMDGGSVTAAAFGIMGRDGRWVIENEGVAPDIEVLEWPKDCAGGRDPTLERGVAPALARPPHVRVPTSGPSRCWRKNHGMASPPEPA
ncbi:MAG: PDZ domain-containing protein [Planctomycetia bacterium]